MLSYRFKNLKQIQWYEIFLQLDQKAWFEESKAIRRNSSYNLVK